MQILQHIEYIDNDGSTVDTAQCVPVTEREYLHKHLDEWLDGIQAVVQPDDDGIEMRFKICSEHR